ncbi:flagellar export protein FliJ [Gallaecimonas pentaromativorans]|uniref:Flagellar FliJ protein n=1 Tax=Gallaecimonas pentaromativorans TaxID=584787 RepID=A0A3N1NS06_9GAMM|nr:flagellar export protein FliJ [Gallaecimonas pentaromativorans]MED5526685.1 flagellar export protein FliJ [Pseudomonadota bacterium]ROQ22584.1 flagellar FliJ protein [Gallaecimonas pentaromativorans]
MSKALELVLDQRKQQEDRALAQLAQARQALAQLQGKLNTLQNYRNGYLKEMQQKAGVGLTAVNMVHYQRFVARLDSGLADLQGQLVQHQQAVASREQAWRVARQDTKAIDLLLERKAQDAAVAAQRREQRELDDLVGRKVGTPIA